MIDLKSTNAVSQKELAKELGVTDRRVRQLVKEQDIPAPRDESYDWIVTGGIGSTVVAPTGNGKPRSMKPTISPNWLPFNRQGICGERRRLRGRYSGKPGDPGVQQAMPITSACNRNLRPNARCFSAFGISLRNRRWDRLWRALWNLRGTPTSGSTPASQ